MIEKIREIVKKDCNCEEWNYHILSVVNYSKKLAKILEEDLEVVEICALLHDIGWIKLNDPKDHEITGQKISEEILSKLNYSKEVIDEVKHCVESHRGNPKILPKTKIAEIIRNADAMSHLDMVLLFFRWRSQKQSYEESFKWIYDKIERDWNKKITIPEAREMVRDKYIALKKVLDNNRELIDEN
ncbi:HD domain-containing protein [Candidatus Pacearchaeota archaeon]|nr:HD domain-containing protein [Candidatus Pacearchaeota archaeon]